MDVERLTLEEWDEALPDRGFEVFHLPEALETLDAHAAGDLVLYGGFKGQQPVGLLPVVEQRRAVGTALLSPPPGFGVPRLGPVVMPASPKRRKRERVNREFTRGVLEALEVESSLTLLRMLCNAAYSDPRPYVWADLDVEPVFTYSLPVDDPEAQLGSVSKSLRREIRDARDLDLVVERAGIEGARAIYDDAAARYEGQDRPFRLSWPYVRDLVEALGDRARAYVARTPAGEYVAGVLALYSNDAAYFWLGGARAVHEGVSVNSLVHWRVVEDVAADPPVASVDRYDLMGANTERLCRYKSKFGPELVPYYVVESGGAGLEVAKTAYRLLSR